MKIDFISMPYIFTDDGQRLHRDQIVGEYKVGCKLKLENNQYIVDGFGNEECEV